jgi:environmental stress-induced protein Ves
MPRLALPRKGHVTLPWKDGQGQTDEIFIDPPGSARDDFAIRVSSAPILVAGRFSAFPGVDRWITLIEGVGLDLDFAGRSERLVPFAPLRFDSSHPPLGTPVGGPVRVINVMAARGVWRLGASRVLANTEEVTVSSGELSVCVIARGTWRVDNTGLNQRDAAILSDGHFRLVPAEDEARAVLVYLLPTQ